MFLAIVLLAWYFGRKAGWKISILLYKVSPMMCMVLCVAWSVGIAYSLRILIDYYHPGWIAKAFSFGVGLYIASPNFGLVNEATIPEREINRHRFMQYFTPTLFVLSSSILAFTG